MTTAQIVVVITVAAAAIGLLVNTVVLLRLPFRVGIVFGKMEESVKRIEQSATKVSEELDRLGETVQTQGTTLARTVAIVDGLERRVQRLEDHA